MQRRRGHARERTAVNPQPGTADTTPPTAPGTPTAICRRRLADRSELERRRRMPWVSAAIESSATPRPRRSRRSRRPSTPTPASLLRPRTRTPCGPSTRQATYPTSSGAGSATTPAAPARRSEADWIVGRPTPRAMRGTRRMPAARSRSRAFTNLTFNMPVKMLQAPNSSQHWYVLQQLGLVRRFTRHEPGQRHDRARHHRSHLQRRAERGGTCSAWRSIPLSRPIRAYSSTTSTAARSVVSRRSPRRSTPAARRRSTRPRNRIC